MLYYKMNIYLYFIPVIIFWTFDLYFNKIMLKHLDNFQLIFLYHIIFSLFYVIIFSYLYLNQRKTIGKMIQTYKKLPLNLYGLIILAVMLAFTSFFSIMHLIKNLDITYFISVIRGISLLLALFIGFFLFKENVSIQRILGTILIVGGIIVIR